MSGRVLRVSSRIVLSLALFAWWATAPLGAQGDPPCPPNSAAVTLTVDLDGGEIRVDPWSVEIVRPGKGDGATSVCWQVAGLGSGHTLVLEGKAGDESYFPSLERTVKHPRSSARSGAPAKAGTWRYQLRLTDAEGATLLTLDPEVIIKG